MSAACFKCRTPLVDAAPEEGPPVAGKTARDRDGWRGTAYKRVVHIPLRCPTCNKTRGVKGAS
jgi:hypothetical protein